MILTCANLRTSPIGTGLIIHKHLNIGTRINMKNMRPAVHHTFSNYHLRIPAPVLGTESGVVGTTPE